MANEIILKNIDFMPDNSQYTNRFKLPSESNPDLEYTIAKNKKTGQWSCSCRGWIIHRHCKHLKAIQPLLPVIEKRKRKEKKPVDFSKLDSRNQKAYKDNKTGNKKVWENIANQLFDSDDTQLYLTILGIHTIPKTIDELKKARNTQMLKAHPDKGGTNKQAVWINTAYKCLSKKVLNNA